MKIIKTDEIKEEFIRYHKEDKSTLESLNSPFIVKLHYAF